MASALAGSSAQIAESAIGERAREFDGAVGAGKFADGPAVEPAENFPAPARV